MIAEAFDERENVIPATTVEARRVLAQLVENLVHLERGQDGLDQHRGANGAARDAELLLRVNEHVVPQTRFQVALHLGQIEIRSAAALDELMRVVEKEETKIKKARGDDGAIHAHVALIEMPAART